MEEISIVSLFHSSPGTSLISVWSSSKGGQPIQICITSLHFILKSVRSCRLWGCGQLSSLFVWLTLQTSGAQSADRSAWVFITQHSSHWVLECCVSVHSWGRCDTRTFVEIWMQCLLKHCRLETSKSSPSGDRHTMLQNKNAGPFLWSCDPC